MGLDINFVSEYAYPNGWNGKLESGSIAVWIDAPHLLPVEKHYPILTDAENRGARQEITDLGRSVGHILMLP